MPKPIEYNVDSLFDGLIAESISSFESDQDVGIVEFAEQFIFNGNNELYPPQRALLKAFYGEPLEEDELLILEEWVDLDRTTWVAERSYQHLIMECGRGGGKTSIISIVCLYEFYKLITLKDPATHYGLLPNSPIAIFVISQSQEQVKETLFAQIRGFAEGSNYFKGLTKSGKVEVLTEDIRCSEKNVLLAAKHTNSKALVGYSIKTLVLDEAARFEIDEFGNSKADLIWSNVGKGVLRFGKKGHKIAISSAWEPGDYIEKLYEVAERDMSMLGFRLRTWDVNKNPNMREEVIKSSEEYIKDPIFAATEFEGIRSSKQGTFMIQENVKACFRGKSCIDANQIPINSRNEEGEVRYYVGAEITRLSRLIEGYSFAHVDYGVKKDSAAMAVSRPINIEGLWHIQVDAFLVWKPYIDRDSTNKGIKRLVSFLDVEEKLLQVYKARKVLIASFDSYQSEYAIQKLHMEGIHTVEMSTSNKNQLLYYTITKNMIDQGLLILPKDSRWSTTAEAELANLIQIPSTGRVDHSKSSSKDIADAIANSAYNCYVHMVKSGLTSALAAGIETIGSQAQKKIANVATPNGSLRGSRSAVNKIRDMRKNRAA